MPRPHTQHGRATLQTRSATSALAVALLTLSPSAVKGFGVIAPRQHRRPATREYDRLTAHPIAPPPTYCTRQPDGGEPRTLPPGAIRLFTGLRRHALMPHCHNMVRKRRLRITTLVAASAWEGDQIVACISRAAWRTCRPERSARGVRTLSADRRASLSARREGGRRRVRRHVRRPPPHARGRAPHLEGVHALALLVRVVHEVHGGVKSGERRVLCRRGTCVAPSTACAAY